MLVTRSLTLIVEKLSCEHWRSSVVRVTVADGVSAVIVYEAVRELGIVHAMRYADSDSVGLKGKAGMMA